MGKSSLTFKRKVPELINLAAIQVFSNINKIKMDELVQIHHRQANVRRIRFAEINFLVSNSRICRVKNWLARVEIAIISGKKG